MMTRSDLTRFVGLKKLLIQRWPQFLVYLLMLFGFLFVILAGFTGTPVGSANFGIVFVWIAWWALLILVMVPFMGRGWCSICPIPLPGEWLQRGSILAPTAGTVTRKRLRWPNGLRNIWLQNLSFLLLALFSSIILTTPGVTSIVLAGMLFLAIGMSVLFERRTFCRYLCPVGGFIGLFSQVSPLALRVKDKQTCADCSDKPCYNGSANGYGCPWDVFPGGLTRNSYCGLCMECLRTCPYDNIAINSRPFLSDLEKPSSRMDESFKTFLMLGAALVYAGIYLGPWGAVKLAAYSVGSPPWWTFTAVFLLSVLGLLPGLFLAGVWLAKSVSKAVLPLKKAFLSFSTALIPLGLGFWMAFSVSFLFSNASYLLMTLSDPLGRGWDLFGTAGTAWQPILAGVAPFFQAGILLVGLLWSLKVSRNVSAQTRITSIPVTLFSSVVSLAMFRLLA